jgi:hypothetical protein
MGIYGEVPGERCRIVLDPYRDSAALVEESDLDYTILRPGWFTHDEAIDYQITFNGEAQRELARLEGSGLIVARRIGHQKHYQC